jgi:hypothetical protein
MQRGVEVVDIWSACPGVVVRGAGGVVTSAVQLPRRSSPAPSRRHQAAGTKDRNPSAASTPAIPARDLVHDDAGHLGWPIFAGNQPVPVQP